MGVKGSNPYKTTNQLITKCMKYLTHYLEQGTKDLMQKHKAFWAIGDEQFNEKKVDGVTYTQLVSGMIVPVDEADALLKGLNENLNKSIKQDIEENGIENIISREIGNHEVTYTGDLDELKEHIECYKEFAPELNDELILKEYRKALNWERENNN